MMITTTNYLQIRGANQKNTSGFLIAHFKRCTTIQLYQ